MRFLLVSLILLLPGHASSQETRQVQCRFLRFGGDDDSATVLVQASKGTEVSCALSTSALSAPVACMATDNKIAFLTAGDKKPAAVVAIPAQVRTAVLVFVKNEGADASSGGLPWKVMAIEDSPKNYPEGGAFVVNLYSKDIRFVIGEHKGMLHPAMSFGYAAPTQKDDFNMAPAVFEFQQGETWRLASESNLRFLPAYRYLIFAFVDPASGRPRIRTIQDFGKTPVPVPAP